MVIIIGVWLCVLFGGGYSALSQTESLSTGIINWVNLPVSKVLDTYKHLVKTELVVATNVRDAHNIALRTEKPMTSDALAHMIEQALQNQAGVVVTHLDNKRTSVTYNDKLELQP